ncbi:MAG: S-formylglutathione hydrolase [Sphingomonadales bacterium]|nr:S-formylglutathione hydrolase [Sphingomonadales bacterium]
MTLETISENRSHDGVQGVYRHTSAVTGTDMTFSVFVPDHAPGAKLPVLTYLSGLTCTHANVTDKGEYHAACARHGIVFVAPDTSPRGPGVANADSYDLGQGAGFYVDATEQPWTPHFAMHSYIADELPALIAEHFPVDPARASIAGHSMGGHGALVMGLRYPDRYRSVSAFAPIVAPSQVPWGRKALAAYCGDDRAIWRGYDAVALIEDGARRSELLVDQGTADEFLDEQLRPELLQRACDDAGIALTLNRREGYDHSYYFIATFMADHIAWHADRLNADR